MRVLTAVVGVLALGFCVVAVVSSWDQFVECRKDISAGRLILGLLCTAVGCLVQALGWYMLMRNLGSPIRLSTALRAWSYSQVAKYVPGKVMAFVARARVSAEDGALPSRVFATALLEIIISLVICLSIWPLSTVLAPGPAGSAHTSYLYLIPLPVLLIALHPRIITGVLRMYYRWRKMPEADSLPQLTLGMILRCGGIYVARWFLYGLGGYFITTAVVTLELGVVAGVIRISGAFVLAWLVGYLFILSPGGLGVREGALAVALSAWMPLGVGAVIAALARLCLSGVELALAGFFWLAHRAARAKSGDVPPGQSNLPSSDEGA